MFQSKIVGFFFALAVTALAEEPVKVVVEILGKSEVSIDTTTNNPWDEVRAQNEKRAS